MKKFLVLAAMLSVILFGFGTSHAVIGVADDVPGTDTVIPFICEDGGTLNTLWSVGDVSGAPNTVLPSFRFAIVADLLAFTRRSVEEYDEVVEWTVNNPDVLVDDCQSLISRMAPAQQALFKHSVITKTGVSKTFYIGYLVYFAPDVDDDRFIPWVYLVDLPKGFAAGFNGYAAEQQVVLAGLLEDGDPIAAAALFPRYLVLNNNAETWNWWIILKGANGTSVAAPADSHRLSGIICNEEEVCSSLNIPLPDELNVISVEQHVPNALHGGVYPKAGFGLFVTQDAGAAASFSDFTTLGWSYQRAQGSTVAGTWSVVHPMHRFYGDVRDGGPSVLCEVCQDPS